MVVENHVVAIPEREQREERRGDRNEADEALGTNWDRCKLSGALVCLLVCYGALFAIIICGDPCLANTFNNHIFLIICVTIFALLTCFLQLLATNLVFGVFT
jgi:hypothetical protein